MNANDLKLVKRWIDEGASYSSTGTEFVFFKILRGIDGKLPDDDGGKAQSAGGGQERTVSLEVPEIIERLPEGRTQYDYLKRLQRRIQHLGNVAAIGVVGSDVYDKLLVLRALKPHFPSSVFFTTDLDAILTHTNQRQHTRNLLIASHYDLALSGGLQEWTPPFRDSYQTSTCLATRLAIHIVQDEIVRESDRAVGDWKPIYAHWFPDQEQAGDSGEAASHDGRDVDALVHVVGKQRTHSLQLPEEGSDAAVLHPVAPYQLGNWHYFFVGAILINFCGMVYSFAIRDRVKESPRLHTTGSNRYVRWVSLRLRQLIHQLRKYVHEHFGQNTLRGDVEHTLKVAEEFGVARGKTFENTINLLLAILVLGGLLLVLIFSLCGAYGPESASFFCGLQHVAQESDLHAGWDGGNSGSCFGSRPVFVAGG